MRISDWSSDVCSSDLDDSRSRQLDRRHVEGDDIADADHRAGNGEAQHGAEFESLLAAEILPNDEIGCEKADGGGQGGRHQRDRDRGPEGAPGGPRSEEHTSELQSLMRISYAVFCLNKKKEPINKS